MSQGFISRRGGVGGGDSNTAFKAFVSGTLTNITADMIANCTVIGDYTFYHCATLQTVSIPESVTTIVGHAFRECTYLRVVMIGNGVTSIGDNAFYGCTSLTSVTVKATTPPTLGYGVFGNTNNSFVIYVPLESVETYKAASGWSTYASKIQAIP